MHSPFVLPATSQMEKRPRRSPASTTTTTARWPLRWSGLPFARRARWRAVRPTGRSARPAGAVLVALVRRLAGRRRRHHFAVEVLADLDPLGLAADLVFD